MLHILNVALMYYNQFELIYFFLILAVSLSFSMYETMSSSNHGNLATYFSSLEKPFIDYVASQLQLGFMPLCSIKSHNREHPCVLPHLREKSPSFDIHHDVSYQLIVSGFIRERDYFFLYIFHSVFQSWKKIGHRFQKYREKRQHFQQTVLGKLGAHM